VGEHQCSYASALGHGLVEHGRGLGREGLATRLWSAALCIGEGAEETFYYLARDNGNEGNLGKRFHDTLRPEQRSISLWSILYVSWFNTMEGEGYHVCVHYAFCQIPTLLLEFLLPGQQAKKVPDFAFERYPGGGYVVYTSLVVTLIPSSRYNLELQHLKYIALPFLQEQDYEGYSILPAA
jgi:hypothetical protein